MRTEQGAGPPRRRRDPQDTTPGGQSVEVATTDAASVPHPTLVAAFEQGWTAGYADGFEVGADVGAARVLLAVESGWPPDLTPLSPQYAELRRLRDIGPCEDPRCGACGVRRLAISTNREKWGHDDYPGADRRALRAAA